MKEKLLLKNDSIDVCLVFFNYDNKLQYGCRPISIPLLMAELCSQLELFTYISYS
jgi:hypothetical protein